VTAFLDTDVLVDCLRGATAEFEQAYALLARHRLTSGLSIPDYLIAAMALSHSARLYTFNLKHFQVIAGLDAQTPYTR
jgi:predicted nucleic acid-binding protein